MTLTLTATYTSVIGHSVTVQWYKDGEAFGDPLTTTLVVELNTITLAIPDATPASDGTYYAIITDNDVADCEVQTDPEAVVVPGCRLEITTQPESQAVDEGGELVLTVVAAEAVGNLTYQWYLGEVELVDGALGGATVSGATTATLTITNIEEALAGNYTVVVTDDGILDCVVTSDAAVVTVASASTNQVSFAFFIEMLSQPDPAGADIISNYDFELWDDPSGSRQSRIRLSMAATGGGADTYTFTVAVSQGAESNTGTSSTVALPLRTWHHVAVVYDGNTGFASVYVDATLIGTSSGTPVVLTTQPYGYLNLTNAAHSVIDYLDSYVCVADLTGVWVGHALTGAELTNLYNGGAGFNGPPWTGITEPTAWWDFDDAGRVDATENFVDTITSLPLYPFGSVIQFESLSNFGVIKTGFTRTLETDITAVFAYTA